MRLMRMTLLIVILSSVAVVGQVSPPSERDVSENWSSRESLPLLCRRTLPPVKNIDRFRGTDSWSFRYTPPGDTAHSDGSFSSDDAAVEAAKVFVREHFGVPPDLLLATSIDHRTMTRPAPKERETTVRLQARHHGIPVDGCGAMVIFAGRSVSRATVSLATLTPLPNSERPIISRKKALAVWSDTVPDEWKAIEIDPEKLQLTYAHGDPHPDAKCKEGETILTPNWIIHDIIVVDAISATIWRNG